MQIDHETEAPRRGRPRDPSRDLALLAAARDVIAQRGVTGATMDEIARVAGTGKDTLYRRWSSKERLTIDLIDTMATDAVRPAPIDPDPRVNLLLFLKDIVRLNTTTDFGAIIAGVVGAASRDDELAARFRAFWARRRDVAAGLVRDVVGDLPDDEIEALLDRVLAPIYYRLLLTGAEITDAYLWEVVVALPGGPTSDTDPSDTPTSDTATSDTATSDTPRPGGAPTPPRRP